MSTENPRATEWWLYMLDCDGRLYTGISTDVDRRLHQHRSGKGGARFTRAARQVELRYRQHIGSHSLALKAEARLKKWSRARKLLLIASQPEQAELLQLLALELSPDASLTPSDHTSCSPE